MLDTRQAPPLSVPLRFFLTAPLFAVVGAALLCLAGSSALLTRWSPLTLGILHCFTAGFMLQVMLGSLFQVLPVALGAPIPRSRLVAGLVHPCVTAGAAMLCAGLMGCGHFLVSIGGALLATGCTVFVCACSLALWRTQARNPVRLLLRCAVAGLMLTASLGFSLVYQFDHGANASFAILFALHALWGMAGWTLPLIAGVAVLVVPMFYMTPRYPEATLHKLSWLGVAALLGTSIALIFAQDWASRLGSGALALLAACFGLLTLSLFWRRKRPRTDATLWGWCIAMIALFAAACIALARILVPESAAAPALEIAIGITALLGAGVGLIGAMQLRILPFLATLHLSPLGAWQLDREPGQAVQLVQVALHGIAIIMLIAALQLPVLAVPGAVMLLGAQLLQGITVWRLALAYRATYRRLKST